jgi:hypothetical protein
MSIDKSFIFQQIDKLIDEYNEQKRKQNSPVRIEKRNGKYYFVVKNLIDWIVGDIGKTGIKPEVMVTDEEISITFKFEDIVDAVKKSIAGLNMDSLIGGFIVEQTVSENGNKDYNLVIPINL